MIAPTPLPRPPTDPQAPPAPVKSLLPFDILRVAIHVAKGWPWILLAALLGAAAAFALGHWRFTTKYTAQVQLVRREMTTTFQASELGESFRPRQFNAATVSAMMHSGPLMEKTAASLSPKISASAFQQEIVIRPEKNTDLISVAWTTDVSPAFAAQGLNKYAENVASLTSDLQAQEAKELLSFLSSQMERTEQELTTVQKELMAFSRKSGLADPDKETEAALKQLSELDLRIESTRIEFDSIDDRIARTEAELAKQDPATQQLNEARSRLAELLTQYTAEYPLVVEQQARVTALEKKRRSNAPTDPTASFQSTGNTVANSLYLDILSLRSSKESLKKEIESLTAFRANLKTKLDSIPDQQLALSRFRGRVAALEETRNLLGGRLREAQLYSERALGYYRLFAPASPDAVSISSRSLKLLIVSFIGAFLAAAAIIAYRAISAATSDSIVSPSDLRRLTRAPVIASLPDQADMDPAALALWRFTTWATLTRSIPAPTDAAFVAGLLSASSNEGKSTWLHLLARAALDRGHKVLAISHGDHASPSNSVVPIADALNSPDRILSHLRSASPAALEINVPSSWLWNHDSRNLWRSALASWSAEHGLVILVELPPASNLDALLLAESLPALLWISQSGKLLREDVSPIIDTLKTSGIHLSAALLNRIPPIFQKLPDLAKFGLSLTLASLSLVSLTDAQDQPPELEPLAPPPAIHGDLPPVSPSQAPAPDNSLPPAGDPLPPLPPDPSKPFTPLPQPKPPTPLAPWQERLTLGPGDLVNLQVFGRKEFTRTQVPINPDGTINYLQVHGFKAAGLTIDELRSGLSTALRNYITNAQIIVTPGAFRSKKYFLLGTVIDRGAYTLDRPMSLLEAAARARGIATGLLEQNTVEIADMRRAFIVRDGRKLPVNFSKLFFEGDLSQNIQLQPGDYIYFPSNIVNEVYILGAVGSPGHTGVTEGLSALGAITVRGGFSRTAWKKKILIVRTPPDKKQPDIITLDAAAILAGKQKDVLLQPRDLVYVHEKPWQRANEILALAMRAFVQTGAATWTGENIGPILPDPSQPAR